MSTGEAMKAYADMTQAIVNGLSMVDESGYSLNERLFQRSVGYEAGVKALRFYDGMYDDDGPPPPRHPLSDPPHPMYMAGYNEGWADAVQLFHSGVNEAVHAAVKHTERSIYERVYGREPLA